MSENVNAVGQRLMLSFDVVTAHVHKDEEGAEVNAQRVYHFGVPYMSPFEEIYAVIEELKLEVQRQEQLNKENLAKIEAEKKAKDTSVKEAQSAVDEASHS